VVIGDLIGLDTSAFTEGDQLYLSSTVAGAFTSTKQYAPNHLVYVGIVTRAHPTLGQIEVNIQNGYEMDELHNVAAQNPSNGDILQYVTSTGLWTKVAGSTTYISEGTNLYYTAARFNSAFAGKTTTDLTEGTNLYFTNARARGAISLTTSGTSGAATYNSSTGVLNIPNYADTDTGITSLNGLTALTQTFAVGTSGTDFGISSDTSTHTFNLPTASATNRGALSSADWTTFNNKQNALTNPITGTGTTNYLPKFTGASALGDSTLINDANGQLGLGVTPSPWSSTLIKAFQIGNLGASISSYTALNTSTPYMFVDNNAYFDGTGDKYIVNNRGAARYMQANNSHAWLIAPTGTTGSAITFTQGMALDGSGNLSVGGSVTTGSNLTVNSPNITLNTASSLGARMSFISTSTNGRTYQIGSNFVTGNGEFSIFDATSGVERFTITSTGNVGIGGTPNYLKFEVIGGTTSKRLGIGTNVYLTNSMDILALSDIGGDIPLGISGETIGFYTNSATERMRILSDGTVCVGRTTNAAAGWQMAVKNGLTITDGTSEVQIFSYFGAGIGTFTNHDFTFRTNNTERGRIFANGNFAIGTTTDAGYKLDVNGSARVSGALGINGAVYGGTVLTLQESGSLGAALAMTNRNSNQTWGFAVDTAAVDDKNFGIFNFTGGNFPLIINATTSASTFSGAVAINNPVNAAVAVASTHKVTIVIGGVTYYLLASNV
jgi:hypothetical protein